MKPVELLNVWSMDDETLNLEALYVEPLYVKTLD